MQKVIIFLVGSLAISLAACSTPPTQTVNTNATTPNANNSIIVSSHSNNDLAATKDNDLAATSETVVPKSETKTKWTQSGNPIDTSKFDAEIKQAESKLKTNPKDETLKKSLAQAFVTRGMALTEARQYASALGDYRKALKLDPGNEEAKKWIDQIIGIYQSINREYPKEGQEPPPLPFKKEQ